MNLQQLRYVRALAETNSFVRAADQCAVTQPTLSNGVAQLEEELGQRIFDRTTRVVSVTGFGRHILPSLLDVLNAQAALVAAAHAFSHPTRRLIRLGVSPLVDIRLIKLAIEPLLRDRPNIDAVFREMNLSEMYQSLNSGQLEFVVGPVDEQAPRHADGRHLLLYSEPLFFIPKGGAAAAGTNAKTISIKAIATETFVMVPDACGLARVTRSLFRRQRAEPHEYSGEALSYVVLQDWAALGLGAAILPRSKIAQDAAKYPSIVDARGRPAMISYQVLWRQGDLPEIEAFAKDLARNASSLFAGLH
jgi:LysR family transcriptional regulator, hydrogen peroxide-inducible genes activator